MGAKDRAMIEREVDSSFDDPVVVHFYEVALANLLVFCDETAAISAANFQNMAATYLLAVWVLINLHASIITHLYMEQHS